MYFIKKILFVQLLIFCLSIHAQKNYYLSNSLGSDSNKGHKSKPWKSLNQISKQKLKPGDTVFFKSGDTFNGHFVLNGSGSPSKPIVITSYGEGNKPIISGEVGQSGGCLLYTSPSPRDVP